MEEFVRINGVGAAWRPLLLPAMEALESDYRRWLTEGVGYIPSKDRVLAAFSTLEPERVRYILFGQDPYPRAESAVGYAFIDGRVQRIFDEGGLSREVNRATSLRNFVKMALVADGRLDPSDTSQAAIAALDKGELIGTMEELRSNFERAGVLLLNTALVFSSKEESRRHIRAWQGFVTRLLSAMESLDPTLILFGSHAAQVGRIPGVESFRRVTLEHPYNHSFVLNPKAHELFGPMRLLVRSPKKSP